MVFLARRDLANVLFVYVFVALRGLADFLGILQITTNDDRVNKADAVSRII